MSFLFLTAGKDFRGQGQFPCLHQNSGGPLQHHDHLGNQFLRILARPIDIVSTCRKKTCHHLHPAFTLPKKKTPAQCHKGPEIPTGHHHWQSIGSMIRLHHHLSGRLWCRIWIGGIQWWSGFHLAKWESKNPHRVLSQKSKDGSNRISHSPVL